MTVAAVSPRPSAQLQRAGLPPHPQPPSIHPRRLPPSAEPLHYLHRPARRMSSVPELREHRSPGLPPGSAVGRLASKPYPRTRGSSAERDRQRGRGDAMMPARGPFDGGGHGSNRLVRQKSIERGIGLPARPIYQGKRSASRSSDRRPGRSDHQPSAAPGQGRRPPQPPGLNMPLAFNSIARERGFSTGSHGSPPPPRARHNHSPIGTTPSNPSSSAPDLSANNEGRPPNPRHPREPLRSHPAPPQHPYSASTSSSGSPHNSFSPPWSPDEVRASLRSAVSEVNRSSTQTAASEAATDDSTMTVDEAIGMYASDTDEDDLGPMERRSRGDSVLGGECSRQGSFAGERPASTRSKGDSVLGGEVSPETRSRMAEQEMALLKEANRRRIEAGEELSPATISKMAEQEAALQREVDRHQQEDANDTHFEDEEEAESDDADEPERGLIEQEFSSNTDSKEADNSESSITVPLTVGEPEWQTSQITSESKSTALPKVRSLQDTPEPTPAQVKQTPIPRPVREPKPFDPKDVRDRYGFRKQTQHITLSEYEEWEVRYNEILDRRRRKWEQLLQESGLTPGEEGPVRFPPKSAKVKRYIRKGIPPEWRGAAWFWYAGGQRYINKHPGLYGDLVKRGLNSPDSELIERDLHRTFPDNIRFKPDPPAGERASKYQERAHETELVQRLRRVLVAFSLYVPRIGYCQSLNFLAGLLLLFLPEEKAFWVLYIMTHTHLPGTHELNLEGSSVDQWVFMVSVRESMPQIWSKIGGGLDGGEVDLNSTKLPPVTLCTSPWFMSGFIGSLPIESVLRVWDCLFYEGSKTIFRIAMTILKTGEPQIKAVNDPMEIFQAIQTIPRRLLDAGALIEACYRRRNGFGHLSQEIVDHRRRERREVFADERAAIAIGGVRASKDDAALRGRFNTGPHSRGGVHLHHHNTTELGRKFKKILKT